MKKILMFIFLLSSTVFALDACNVNSTTVLNSTLTSANNSALNYTVTCVQDLTCAPNPVCNLNLTLLANTTFSETTNPCNVHIKTIFPQDYNGTMNITGQRCDLNITLLPNQSYTRFDSECNVHVESIIPTNETNLSQYNVVGCDLSNLTLLPQLENDTYYFNTNGTCNANITVKGFVWPNNSIPIAADELLRINQQANKCIDLLEKSENENVTYLTSYFGDLLAEERIQKDTLNKIIEDADLCTISDGQMLKAWKNLPTFEKKYLDDFSTLYGEKVSSSQFADMIQADFVSRGDALFYSQVILQDYAQNKIATSDCNVEFDPLFNRNVTRCSYLSNIIPSCINRTSSLLVIDNDSYWNGFAGASIVAAAIIAIILGLIYIHIKYPGVVPGF